MFCINCIGTGIVTGVGEYRGVCAVCDGLGRSIIIKDRKHKSVVLETQKKENTLIKN